MVRPEDRAFVRWREAGDGEALARVYDDAAPVLLRIALHHVRHPAAAEDLVQATFLAAIENAAGYDAARPLLGWLVGILHNQAKWLQRREGRSVDAARLGEPAAARDPLAAAQGAELTAQCDEAIDALPEVYRPVLRLSLRHELSAAEIAHALGRPAGTVRSQLTRGLELLRAALPAGVALAAFAVLTPGRGLAAVRETVLAAGAQHATAAGAATAATAATGDALATAAHGVAAANAAAITTTTAALAAGVTMKKTTLALVAAALLLVGAWLTLDALAGARALAPSGRAVPVAANGAAAAAGGGDASPGAQATSPPRTAVSEGRAPWRLSGTVVDAAARPFAGAGVEVVVRYEREHEPLATATTGADGRYTVDLDALRVQPPIDLDRATLLVAFRADGHRENGEAPLPHRDPQRALEVVADATLRPVAVLVGRVVDAAGRAVAGAEVTLHAVDGSALAPSVVPSTTTAADGGYLLCAPPTAATVLVRAQHVAFGRASAACEPERGRDHTVADLVLRTDTTLRGRVVFENGEPAVGIGVEVHDPQRDDQTVATTGTAADGTFAVCTLPPGRYRVTPDCHTRGPVPSALVGTGEDATTLVLTGLHLLRFRFEDEQGRAIRPMGVAYQKWEAGLADAAAAFAAGGELTPELDEGHGSGFGGIRSVLLGSGTWLHVEASHGNARAEVMVQALPPRNVHDVTLTLRELRRTASLRLHLACTDGSAPGDAKLYLHQLRLGEPGSSELESERDGGALVVRWHPGRYRLEVRPKMTGTDFGAFARFEQVVELRDGETTVVARTVEPGGRVRLHLHAPDPQSRAVVEDFAVDTLAAAGELGRRSFVRVLADGWMSLGSAPANTPLLWQPLLPPGRHVLTFRSRDYAEQQLTAIVEPRAVTDVHVWLQPR